MSPKASVATMRRCVFAKAHFGEKYGRVHAARTKNESEGPRTSYPKWRLCRPRVACTHTILIHRRTIWDWWCWLELIRWCTLPCSSAVLRLLGGCISEKASECPRKESVLCSASVLCSTAPGVALSVAARLGSNDKALLPAPFGSHCLGRYLNRRAAKLNTTALRVLASVMCKCGKGQVRVCACPMYLGSAGGLSMFEMNRRGAARPAASPRSKLRCASAYRVQPPC